MFPSQTVSTRKEFNFPSTAATGIGKETSFSFAEAGVKGVAFAELNEEGAQEANAESRKYATDADYPSLVVKVDVADEDAVQNMVKLVVKEFVRTDYAVNSAGMGNVSGAITPHLKLDVFTKFVDVDIKGAVYFVRAVTAVMANQEELFYNSSLIMNARLL